VHTTKSGIAGVDRTPYFAGTKDLNRMRKFITSFRLFIISSVLFICSIILVTIVISCRKISQQAEEAKANELTIKFFTGHCSSDPVITAAENFVKHQNEKYNFLNSLTKRIGFPYWDKSMLFSKLYAAKGSSADSVNVVYIPFARDSEENVNAALIINMKPSDTTFRFLYDWQYAAYGFDTTVNPEKWNARDVFHIFTLFDKMVFNIKQFRITDKNLLSASEKESIKNLELNVDSILVIGTLKENGKRVGNKQELISFEVCNTYSICVQPCLKAFKGSSFNKIGTDDCCEETFEWEECTTYYIDDGGGGAPPPPPTDPGSGGGGGGTGDPGSGWDDPCSGGGAVQPRGEVVKPCGGDPGWQPAPDDGGNSSSNEDPCTTAQNAAKKMDSIFALSKADSVLNTIPDLATDSLEKGFPIYQKFSVNPYDKTDTTFTAIYKSDNVQTGSTNHIDITAAIPYLYVWAAALHTHPPNGYTAQSAADIYSLLDSRMNSDSHFEGSFVFASDSSQHAITITDYSKASLFFNTKSVYLDTATSGWKEDSDIGKAFKDAYKYFEKKYKNYDTAT
jgi:hypothetical protein